MTTENNKRARTLVRAAKGNLFRLGIALHGLQDTFSHQSFSGWREELNSCFPWYYVESGLPNVGHAEMLVIPDVVNYVWTEPSDGRRIDNKVRTMDAATNTFRLVASSLGKKPSENIWDDLRPDSATSLRLTAMTAASMNWPSSALRPTSTTLR